MQQRPAAETPAPPPRLHAASTTPAFAPGLRGSPAAQGLQDQGALPTGLLYVASLVLPLLSLSLYLEIYLTCWQEGSTPGRDIPMPVAEGPRHAGRQEIPAWARSSACGTPLLVPGHSLTKEIFCREVFFFVEYPHRNCSSTCSPIRTPTIRWSGSRRRTTESSNAAA